MRTRGIGAIARSLGYAAVAATIVAAFGRFVSPRVVRIVEEGDGRSFTLSGAENGGGQGRVNARRGGRGHSHQSI